MGELSAGDGAAVFEDSLEIVRAGWVDDIGLPDPGLSDGVFHRAMFGEVAKQAAAVDRAAVLDELSDSHVCVDDDFKAGGIAE